MGKSDVFLPWFGNMQTSLLKMDVEHYWRLRISSSLTSDYKKNIIWLESV